MASIKVIARISVKAGGEEQVKSVLSNLVKPTRKESGCISYELLHNSQEPTEFVLLEEWSTQIALDGHTEASHTKNAEAKVADWLVQVPPDVRTYQTVA